MLGTEATVNTPYINELRHLSDLCQEAEGPDVDLNLRIGCAVNGAWLARASYTKSFEAALTLVPSG